MTVPTVLQGMMASVNQPLLAWGATVLLALPSSPPRIHSPCLCMWSPSPACGAFDRCNPDEMRKDAKKDAESREPQISIKG